MTKCWKRIGFEGPRQKSVYCQMVADVHTLSTTGIQRDWCDEHWIDWINSFMGIGLDYSDVMKNVRQHVGVTRLSPCDHTVRDSAGFSTYPAFACPKCFGDAAHDTQQPRARSG